jgi:RHS repeat-associated protein
MAGIVAAVTVPAWWLLVAALSTGGALGPARAAEATWGGTCPPHQHHWGKGHCPPERPSCPLSQGYWKTHPHVWPVRSLVLGDAANPAHTYAKSALLILLYWPAYGDASLILAHQLIAAKLNVANGSNPAPVAAALADADALLGAYHGRLPHRVKPSSSAGRAMVAAAGILDRYNTGTLPDSCGQANVPPVASAGPDQTRLVGDTAQLDGSGSTDADGDLLAFQWSFVSRPAGSAATLSEPSAVRPTFHVDSPGTYVVQLVVSDGPSSSLPDTVRIDTANSRPRADAGPDQTVPVGTLVELDGGGSSDVDGDPLTFRWSLVAQPIGSQATLTDPASSRPAFTVDLPGTYVAELVVNDGALDSVADTVEIDTANSPPVADAGSDQTGVVGAPVVLDGRASADVDGDALTFRWSFTTRPHASGAGFDDPAVPQPTVVPDLPGDYVAQLIVNDGTVDGAPDTVVVTVTPANQAPIVSAGPDQTITLPSDSVVLNGSVTDDGLPAGGTPSVAWSRVSGLGTVTFGNAASPVTTATFSGSGTYVLRLTATDGALVSADEVTVTVSPAPVVNHAPLVDAGADQSLTLPSDTVTLNGTVTDDGLPAGGALTVGWSQVSGPGAVAFGAPATPTTTARFPVAGTWVLRLTASDGERAGSDDVTITVNPAAVNRPPLITSAPRTTAVAGEPYAYAVAATDPDAGETLTFSLPIAPAGMSIDAATGLVQWIPTNAQTGLSQVAVRVEDAGGLFATQGFSVQVGTAATNAGPTALDDAYAARTGETLGVPAPGVLANDRDPDGNPLIARQLTHPRSGTATLGRDGSFSYTPYTFRAGELVRADNVNLAVTVPGTTARASSVGAVGAGACGDGGVNRPQCATDGSLGTSWLSANTDVARLGANSLSGGGPFLEVVFPQDVTVSKLQVLGHREPFLQSLTILAGAFQLFDATGAEIFNSGSVELSAPGRDGTVAVPGLFQRATNIARALPGAVYRATSAEGLDQAARAFDGDPLTQWLTRFPATLPEFIEVEFPADVTVHRVRTAGIRGQALGPRDFTSLVVQAFDAAGTVLFDSAAVAVPADRADATVEVGGIAGIRRVRVTGTAVETPGANAGFAEVEVISVETSSVPLNDRVRRARFTSTADVGSQAGVAEFKVVGSALVRREGQVEPNLGQLLPTIARASSSAPGNPPESLVDDSLRTNWYAGSAAPGEFVELEFPLRVTVSQIVGANPSADPGGFGTSLTINCSGAFTLLGADGTILFDSGPVNEPTGFISAGDTFTLAIPNVGGVRRVRYTSAGCGPSFPPGFSELRVFGSAPVTTPAFQLVRKLQALVGREVHSTPIVVNLTDDNGDGVIDARDVPDVVVPVESTASQVTGEIKVISGDDGRELFTAGGPDLVSPWSEVAAGDLDGDGRPDIVAVHSDGNHLIAFDHTGQVKWVSDASPMPSFLLGGTPLIGGAVSIANLDGGPRPHAIVGASVFDADGRLLGDGRNLGGTTGGVGLRSAISVVADLDLDGVPEIVAGPTAYRLAGGVLTKVWQRTDLPDGYAAIGNFDDDPFPEIVIVACPPDAFSRGVCAGQGRVYMLNHDGTDAESWNLPTHAPVFLPGGGQGGAPTIADVDGDGIPEIGVAGASSYTVFRRDGSVRWTSVTTDRSSNATGSTVFDLDGDGTVEIVYRDEEYLRIYRGADGVLLAKLPVRSSTWSELPVIADVDNDGHADIVVTSDRIGSDPLIHTGVYVIQDVANAWVPTRRIWNQHGYHVTNVGEDGAIPAVESPHWLLPGRNNFRLNATFPADTADQGDSFTYVAGDGSLESNVATVRLALRTPNSPPRITSAPVTTAATGVLYTYAALAADPDPGDLLTFSLPTAPAGMTLDATTGLIRWTPTPAQLGRHDVVVRVHDARGTFALQGYAVQVASPVFVPDVVGQPQAAASAAITAAGFAIGAVSTRASATTPAGAVLSQSPAGGAAAAPGSAVALVVSSGPPPAGIVPDVVGQAQASAEADIRAAGFAVGPVTGQHSAQVAPGVVITQAPAGGTSAPAGSPVSLVVSVGPPPGDLDLDGDGVTGNQGDCDDTNPAIRPGAADAPGDGIDQNCNGRDSIAGDDTPPTAVIESPAEDAVVTQPTDIVGTATDANFLRYRLELARMDENGATTIGSGTSPVINGALGRLDPTLLENGLYRVRLIAEDVNGGVAADDRVYRIDGLAKVGNFRLSFTDLSIPVSGIPITIVRTYDSRVKTKEDFGIGWTLDIKRGLYRHNRTPGLGWTINDLPAPGGALPCIGGTTETRSHRTEVRLSDRESYVFELRIANANLGITGACEGTASFHFIEGTRPGATLEIIDGTSVIYLRGGNDVLLDMNDFLEGTERVYDPQRVRFTTAEGVKIVLERGAGITGIEDLNGNTVSITPNGIVHSDGTSVAFIRDTQGRITRIVDPHGNTLSYVYDANGDLTEFVDQVQNRTTFTYDFLHNVQEIVDPLGRRPVRAEYDANGRLVAVIDANGNRSTVDHDLDARREVITDRLGNVAVYEYDARGNVVRSTDPLGHVTTMTYDGRDNKLSETDPLGNTRTYTYDASDNLLTDTDALGNTTTYTYNNRRQVLTRHDARGGVTSYTYDSRGNRLSETDPLGSTTTHTYDTRGRRLTTTDPTGATTRFGYDSNGNLVQETAPTGVITSYSHDANGRVLTETTTRTSEGTSEPLTATYQRDSSNRLVRATDRAGGTLYVTYTRTGKLESYTDQLGHVSSFSYDAQNRLIRVDHPDGTAETRTYDAEGCLLTETDQAGRTTRYVYDALGRLVTTTYPDSSTRRFAHDAAGRLVSATDELGRTTALTYDAAGRNTSVRDPLGGITNLAYDAAGNLIARTDRNGRTTTFTYDLAGRRTRTTFADGTLTADGYDPLRRKITAADQAGNITRFQYDDVGNLVSVTDALGNVTRYTYDEQRNRLGQTDPLGNGTLFGYDPLGRLIRKTLPRGQTETRVYDAAHNLIRRTDFNGATTSYTYDGFNRVVSRTLPSGETHTFTYTPTGRLARFTDPRGATTITYDLRDRPTHVSSPDGAEIAYTYDAAGNRTAVTTSGGTTSYSYDAVNRLTELIDAGGRRTDFAYDPEGNLTRIAYPNGVVASHTFDSLNRLTGITQTQNGTTLRSYAYTLGPAGHRARVVEDSGRAVDYTYDALFRLVREQLTPAGGGAVSTIDYTYDAAGNRRGRTDASEAVSYTYDANNRLLSAGTATFAYDANGNMIAETTSGATTAYSYDVLDRLVHVALPGGTTTEFGYDALGHRVRKEDAAETIRYLVDPFGDNGLAQVLREMDEAGIPLTDYVYGGEGRPVSHNRGNDVAFYLADGYGSTRLLSNPAGAITDSYDYDAFGRSIRRTGTSVNSVLFNGQRLDAATGLYHLRARYYSPNLGRFTTVDPVRGDIVDPLSLHPYTYAHNDPVNRSDPSGEFTLAQIAVTSAVVGVVAAIAYGGYDYYINRSLEQALTVAGLAFVEHAVLTANLMSIGGGVKAVLTAGAKSGGAAIVGEAGKKAVEGATRRVSRGGLERVTVVQAEQKIVENQIEAQLALMAKEAAQKAATRQQQLLVEVVKQAEGKIFPPKW